MCLVLTSVRAMVKQQDHANACILKQAEAAENKYLYTGHFPLSCCWS
jgi:hypothetical protein